MKAISKRKPFKTNNSSGVLYGLHISNAPTMGGSRRGRDVNALGKSNCTAIDVSFIFVLNKMMLNRKTFFAAL